MSKAVDCSVHAKHYRAQGRRNRPDVVELLDKKGSVLIALLMDYGSGDRPLKETRVFHQKPEGLNIYEMGTRYRFSPMGKGKWQKVTIVTELDSKGRPVKVTKTVAGKVEYSMEREFRSKGMVRETILDSGGKIRIQSEFHKEGEKLIEVMRDANGKVIMQRSKSDSKHAQNPSSSRDGSFILSKIKAKG